MVTASHNPKEYTGMKLVRRGALPVGGESGLLDVRDRAMADPDTADGSAARCDRRLRHLAGVRRPGALVRRRRRDQAAAVVIDAANGMAGTMLPPVLERLPGRGSALLLRAGRLVPEPRAEPAPAREPRVHRPQDARGRRRPRGRVRRRRRPLLLRRRHGRVRPRRLRDRPLRRERAREGAGCEGHLRRAREPGGAARRSSAPAASRS